MLRFLIRRLLELVPLLLGITALTFLLLQLAPGDLVSTLAANPQISPATLDSMRHRFGLDQPWYVQYALYLRNIFLAGDFGESFSRHQPVRGITTAPAGSTSPSGARSAGRWTWRRRRRPPSWPRPSRPRG